MASGLNECLDFVQKINAEIRKQNSLKNRKINFNIKVDDKKKKETIKEKGDSLYISYWDKFKISFQIVFII